MPDRIYSDTADIPLLQHSCGCLYRGDTGVTVGYCEECNGIFNLPDPDEDKLHWDEDGGPADYDEVAW